MRLLFSTSSLKFWIMKLPGVFNVLFLEISRFTIHNIFEGFNKRDIKEVSLIGVNKDLLE